MRNEIIGYWYEVLYSDSNEYVGRVYIIWNHVSADLQLLHPNMYVRIYCIVLCIRPLDTG